MACEQMASQEWRSRLDAYVDGELDAAEAQAVWEHTCRAAAGCAADVLERVQMKRSVQMAGKRYARER